MPKGKSGGKPYKIKGKKLKIKNSGKRKGIRY